MEQSYLIINLGSASKKYSIYWDQVPVFSAHYEFENKKHIVTFSGRDGHKQSTISQKEFDSSTKHFLNSLKKNIKLDPKEITKVGIRIVAPGKFFQTHRVINKDFLIELKKDLFNDPIHIKPLYQELENLLSIKQKWVLIGASDSEFHQTMPFKASRYALPEKDGVQKFGYHGLSVKSVLRKVHGLHPHFENKIIVCHLGSGSSITAIKNHQSIDTTMGFTPLEGLPMGTRVGDIDAGAVIALAKKKNLSWDELEKYLYTKAGLLGLSGKSNDIRDLLALEKKDKGAAQALEVFIYRIQKYIGSFIAALGGLDLLVLTGTISERSKVMRQKICRGLETFDIHLDHHLNDQLVHEGVISKSNKKVKVVVLASDENREILRVLQEKRLT